MIPQYALQLRRYLAARVPPSSEKERGSTEWEVVRHENKYLIDFFDLSRKVILITHDFTFTNRLNKYEIVVSLTAWPWQVFTNRESRDIHLIEEDISSISYTEEEASWRYTIYQPLVSKKYGE